MLGPTMSFELVLLAIGFVALMAGFLAAAAE
jgi:hypothetical protein